ncbi:DUF1206 domain-containing protein [Naasia aerilata]|uniref:Membrane protein n=1 Tax=Naasia aerilata TaxID=1162966 RepID=A0ABM8G856_9MICO|nr:DUF1206 domain-containing protein [Naasia aerilata]BDZ44369.1 membrane protein [Naasia aerilata]
MATASAAKSEAQHDAGRLRQSTWFRAGARTGFAVAGLLHLLIGALAISVAVGGGGQETDQSGALAALATNPLGRVVLWVVVVGLFAVGVWQVLEAITVGDADPKKRNAKRIKEAGIAVAYFAVAVTASQYATGGGGSTEQGTEVATAGLLGSPLGVALLLVVAAIALGVGAGFIMSGFRKSFEETLVLPPGAAGGATVLLGRVGYVAKGIAVAVIGVLFATAVFTADPKRAGGLDGALNALARLPYGVVILLVIGIGFVAYGLFYGVRGWRARL